MSRCFPFPPPGYVRNPAAVAVAVPVPVVETTDKLQKEMEKADRKKEKRGKKALKQAGGEVSKHSKRSHKKRKHEDVSIAGQESRNASKELVEHLEKSGISEEHGAPCSIPTVHGSPESSQDSSKRRKVVLPSSQNKNGPVLRIKFKSSQDPPSAMLDSSTVIRQPPVLQTSSGSSLLSNQNTIQPQIVRSAATHQQSLRITSQAVPKQMDVQRPAKISPNVSQKVDPLTSARIMQNIDPLLGPSSAKLMRSADSLPAQLTQRVPLPAKVSQRVDLPPAKVLQRVDLPPAKVLQRVDLPPTKVLQSVDLPPAQVLQRVDPLVSSKLLQRDARPASVKVQQKEIGATALRQPGMQQPPVLQKSVVPVETPVMKQLQANSLHKEEPCSSGRTTERVAVPEVKQSKSDRKKSRKADKKEKKFGDLFVTWNPPSFEIEDSSGLGDQDWLLGCTSKPDARISGCTASDGSLPVQPVEQFSWQPRAIHLPDLNLYQLPYVVPF